MKNVRKQVREINLQLNAVSSDNIFFYDSQISEHKWKMRNS